MLDNVRTHQLINQNITADGLVTIATVPAGQRWLVKWVGYRVASATTGVFLLGIFDGVDDIAIIAGTNDPTRFQLENSGPIYAVLEPGQQLVYYADAVDSDGIQVHAGGIIFEQPGAGNTHLAATALTSGSRPPPAFELKHTLLEQPLLSIGELGHILVLEQLPNDAVEASVVDLTDLPSTDCTTMTWLAHKLSPWYGGWLRRQRLRRFVLL